MRMPIAVAALFLSLALTGTVHAQNADQATSQLTGTVVSTGNISMVVRGDDGQERSFVVVSTTLLPSQRLAAGDRVAVSYRSLDATRAEAVDVELLRPATASEPGAFGK